MKQKFREIHLSKANRERLDTINSIIQEYQREGYRLTLRQLYYQLVSRDIIANQQKEYAKLSRLLTEGRMAGIVDWSAIEDRLRQPEVPSAWDGPAELLESAANQYRKNRMRGQDTYIEVWVEKDALSGVLSRVTEAYHVPILVNRGYGSVSAMYEAYRRFDRARIQGQQVHILYLGDHDPSGLDMIRDVEERIREFFDGKGNWVDFTVTPIALTAEQIREYNPPPNPAKMSDTRAGKYTAEHGYESWEVDALKPEVLNQLLTDAINDLIDIEMWDAVVAEERAERKKLLSFKNQFDESEENSEENDEESDA